MRNRRQDKIGKSQGRNVKEKFLQVVDADYQKEDNFIAPKFFPKTENQKRQLAFLQNYSSLSCI